MRRMYFILSLLLLTACSNGFKSSKASQLSITLPQSITDQFPASDKLDSNCMTSSAYDTCLFFKNPVAQQSAALSSTSRDSLLPLQIFGVKLTNLNGSGFLENESIKIKTSVTTRLSIGGLDALKIPVTKTDSSEVEQLQTYYYLNRAVQYISARGPLAVSGQALNVIVDESASGWKPETKTIYLKRVVSELPAAFDATQSLYLLGLANAHMASGGAINVFPGSDANHKNCGGDAKGCCASAIGCARAIAAGSATYFVAMMFPDKPVIGELAGNRTAGVRLCKVSDRDLNLVSSQTAIAAYQICVARPGDVNILGGVYASIWWQLRAGTPEQAYIVDHLYLKHLQRLSGTDTFSTAKAKILSIDNEINSGHLKDRITQEFARRGL